MIDFFLIFGAMFVVAISGFFILPNYSDLPWEWKGGNTFVMRGDYYTFLVEQRQDLYYIMNGWGTRADQSDP